MYLKCAVLFLFLRQESLCSEKRVKRVVDGDTFNGRPSVYSVIKYHGVVGTAHGIPWWLLRYWESLKNTGWYGEVICSGSLLAPMIFQTACHCVSTYDYSSPKFVKPPIIKNNFESRAVVYVGLSNQYGDSSMMDGWPILAERFIVHSKCGVIGQKNYWELGTYDYGLIRLDTSYLLSDWKYPFLEIRFAPQYTVETIMDFHPVALERQLVCMHIGFGQHDEKIPYGSETLRHGWAVLIPYAHCVRLTARVKWKEFTPEQIKGFMTWVCTGNFAKHDQYVGGGDSGSPLTCDNRYYGILSGALHMGTAITLERTKYQHLSLFHALAYNLYATAINYRIDLIHQLYLNATSYTDARRDIPVMDFSFAEEQSPEFPIVTSSAFRGFFPSFILCMCFL